MKQSIVNYNKFKNILKLYKVASSGSIIKSVIEMQWYYYCHKWTLQDYYYYNFSHYDLILL